MTHAVAPTFSPSPGSSSASVGARAKLDQVCADAVEIARAAVTEDVAGPHLDVVSEGERLVTHYFECMMSGYRGWRWAVTVARVSRSKQVTICETVLLPGADALTTPDWVPWNERVQPGDLGVGDLMPTAADDERLVPGYLLSDDPAVDDAVWELGLGRVRVLSREGRLDAAERWYEGDAGPHAAITTAAPANARCVSCGFFLPLAGSMSAMFGACANVYAPDDGRVVSNDHGCGAHSEVLVEQVVDIDEAPTIYDDAEVEPVLTDAEPVAVEAEPVAVEEVSVAVEASPIVDEASMAVDEASMAVDEASMAAGEAEAVAEVEALVEAQLVAEAAPVEVPIEPVVDQAPIPELIIGAPSFEALIVEEPPAEDLLAEAAADEPISEDHVTESVADEAAAFTVEAVPVVAERVAADDAEQTVAEEFPAVIEAELTEPMAFPSAEADLSADELNEIVTARGEATAEHLASEEAVLDETAPEEFAPEEFAPEETSPEVFAFDEAAPQDAVLEEQVVAPEETASEEFVPEEFAFDEAAPQETVLEEQADTPDETSVEETAPQEPMPEGTAPEQAWPIEDVPLTEASADSPADDLFEAKAAGSEDFASDDHGPELVATEDEAPEDLGPGTDALDENEPIHRIQLETFTPATNESVEPVVQHDAEF